MMNSKLARLALLGMTFTLGACSTTGGTGTSAPTLPLGAVLPSLGVPILASAPAATPSPTPEPSATPEPSSSDEADASATPGPINPCTLLTQDEASGYIGTKLGAGKLENVTPLMVCTWAKGATKLKIFLAPPTDPVAAKAYYEANKSRVPEGGVISELPNFFDGALIASGKTPIGTLDGIFVLDKNEFFELYCEFPACDGQKLMDGANLIAGRL